MLQHTDAASDVKPDGTPVTNGFLLPLDSQPRVLSDNLEALIVVDNMLAHVESGVEPPAPLDYRARLLGLSTMPASVGPMRLVLDPATALLVARPSPGRFDARDHLIAWSEVEKNKHAGLVKYRVS